MFPNCTFGKVNLYDMNIKLCISEKFTACGQLKFKLYLCGLLWNADQYINPFEYEHFDRKVKNAVVIHTRLK